MVELHANEYALPNKNRNVLSASTSYLNIYLVPYIPVHFEVFSWVFWLQLLPTLEADLLSATVLTNVSEFIDQTCSLGHLLGTKMLVKLNPVEKETSAVQKTLGGGLWLRYWQMLARGSREILRRDVYTRRT